MNAVVFLDLKKPFDTVDHGILLSKLNAYGIRGVVHKWFESYLNGRHQKCLVNGCLSENRALTCGVPQGTILGPLLFLLYINDLPNCLSHSQPRMFADDTHLTFADNDIAKIELNLINELESIREWLITSARRLCNHLGLYVCVCVCMCVCVYVCMCVCVYVCMITQKIINILTSNFAHTFTIA